MGNFKAYSQKLLNEKAADAEPSDKANLSDMEGGTQIRRLVNGQDDLNNAGVDVDNDPAPVHGNEVGADVRLDVEPSNRANLADMKVEASKITDPANHQDDLIGVDATCDLASVHGNKVAANERLDEADGHQ